ncbi:MAG: hypothetical protein JWO92_1724 [Chitinophagaceae bacterium]|nr:hypothetical protein [Chitinophagaceae bacterium]
MKKVIFLSLVIFSVASCKDDAGTSTTASKDSTAAATDSMSYPYTIKHPDAWVPGDRQHTMNVLKSLKAYENGNVDECVSYFGDSVTVRFDEMDAKLSNDSLKTFFKKGRSMNKSVQIDMYDWESVKSKATNEEYVSLWYKQVWEDNNGKKDSLSVMDDLKIEKGKIVELDEKTRKYPKKKV